MALNDHLPAPPAKGPRCTVSVALDALDRDDRHTLLGWLNDRDVSAGRIAAAVRSGAGVPLTITTVHRHRRHECGCDQ